MTTFAALWCRLALRHRGHVVWVNPGDVRWMCDNCGEVSS